MVKKCLCQCISEAIDRLCFMFKNEKCSVTVTTYSVCNHDITYKPLMLILRYLLSCCSLRRNDVISCVMFQLAHLVIVADDLAGYFFHLRPHVVKMEQGSTRHNNGSICRRPCFICILVWDFSHCRTCPVLLALSDCTSTWLRNWKIEMKTWWSSAAHWVCMIVDCKWKKWKSCLEGRGYAVQKNWQKNVLHWHRNYVQALTKKETLR